VCNLDCEYCFGHFNDVPQINKIDIEQLLKTLDKTGKIFRISFTGGEPFLIPNIVEAMKAISSRHFVSFNTNLISPKINDLADSISPKRVVHIHASFHYEELLKRKLLERFIDNYLRLKRTEFSIHAEAVAYPCLRSKITEMNEVLSEHGITLQYSPYFGIHDDKSYPESYTNEELKIFGLSDTSRLTYAQKGAFCNAGYNVFVAFHEGKLKPCFHFKESCGNLYDEIIFSHSMKQCPFSKCGCPLNIYDEKLYLEAMKHFNLI